LIIHETNTKTPPPPQSLPELIVNLDDNFVWEEVLNSLTHGFGLLLAVVGSIFLLIKAFDQTESTFSHKASAIIYSFSLIFLYSSSLFFHAFFKLDTTKKVFHRLDHIAIYVLIAGTYTPFCLVLLPGHVGLLILSIVGTLGFIGIVSDVFWFGKFPKFNLILYLLQGWSLLFAGGDLVEASKELSFYCFVWLLVGGLIYTVGVVFFRLGDKIPIYHTIWHVFVIAGSICHYLAIYIYVIPKPLA